MTMVKIIWSFSKNKYNIMQLPSTIHVAIRETGSSEPCDNASRVAMTPEIL